MMQHTLSHALRPVECQHNMADITHCVICERRLDPARSRVDTCGAVCSWRLRILQQAQP